MTVSLAPPHQSLNTPAAHVAYSTHQKCGAALYQVLALGRACTVATESTTFIRASRLPLTKTSLAGMTGAHIDLLPLLNCCFKLLLLTTADAVAPFYKRMSGDFFYRYHNYALVKRGDFENSRRQQILDMSAQVHSAGFGL